MLDDVLRALGLMLVFEGIMPFLVPDRWLKFLTSMTTLEPRYIRVLGLASMLFGLSMLIFMR